MKVTRFTDEGNQTGVSVSASPAWEPFDEYDDQPLQGVRLVVVERLANPPSSQFASWFPKSLRDLFGGPERTANAQPERATSYAASN